jgi:hypothetical protein
MEINNSVCIQVLFYINLLGYIYHILTLRNYLNIFDYLFYLLHLLFKMYIIRRFNI